MAQALYRKYRSRSFDEVVGQEHVTSTIVRAIEQGKISHAYLFTGPRGTGKTSIARILAHAINQLVYSDTPHLDIIEIDAASNRRIEDIRDLREKVHLAPVSAPYKVYIIDEVHMLTSESFNALLKTLEEPPAHVVFILATTELHKLPATITSRTQRFAFRPPSVETIVTHLKTIAKQEKLALSDDALRLIAEHGDGSFRDSISLLDQVSSLTGQEITEEMVAELLGLPARSSLEALLANSLAGQHTETLQLLGRLEAGGLSSGSIASSLLRLAIEKLHDEPAAIRLIEKLAETARAPHPAASLRVALLQQPVGNGLPSSGKKNDEKPKPTSQAAAVTAARVIIEASSPVANSTEEKPTPKPKTASSKQAKHKETEPATSSNASKPQLATNNPPPNLTALQSCWGNVLADIKKHSAPLFGALKTAELRASKNGGLELAFKFALHRRKFDDAKHKAVLVAAIAKTLGSNTMEISTILDVNAIPSPLLTKPAENTPEAASVIEAMGGGHVVQPPA